jgi:hypothetical protein
MKASVPRGLIKNRHRDVILNPILSERRQIFYVGSHELDPQAAGFRSKAGQRAFKFDASLPGNLNTGHYYGTDLTDEERWDLIEFLKTL